MPRFSYESWRVPVEILRMLAAGRIEDLSGANDECPSFGLLAADRWVVRIWVGQPDPADRIDSGCRDRYAVTARREKGDDPGEEYFFSTAREAVNHWKLLLDMHDGPAKFRLLGA